MASWIITKEYSEHTGTNEHVGEFQGNKAYLDDKKAKHIFRLLDGDDQVYFEGLSGNSSSFEPLDHFGVAFGCTDIQYFENGKWEWL